MAYNKTNLIWTTQGTLAVGSPMAQPYDPTTTITGGYTMNGITIDLAINMHADATPTGINIHINLTHQGMTVCNNFAHIPAEQVAKMVAAHLPEAYYQAIVDFYTGDGKDQPDLVEKLHAANKPVQSP